VDGCEDAKAAGEDGGVDGSGFGEEESELVAKAGTADGVEVGEVAAEPGVGIGVEVEGEAGGVAGGAEHAGGVVLEAALVEDADEAGFDIVLAAVRVDELAGGVGEAQGEGVDREVAAGEVGGDWGGFDGGKGSWALIALAAALYEVEGETGTLRRTQQGPGDGGGAEAGVEDGPTVGSGCEVLSDRRDLGFEDEVEVEVVALEDEVADGAADEEEADANVLAEADAGKKGIALGWGEAGVEEGDEACVSHGVSRL
jgi:hypothetical protein